jgi:GH24 family phage-related lysozyme (muramidase)
MHAEIKQQLFGGEVSDYYKAVDPKSIKQDNAELADIYASVSNKRIIAEAPDLTPPPPAIVQKAVNNSLSYQEIYDIIKDHEGYRPQVYKDSVGKPTIGIGFNLTRSDARALIKQVGADYDQVLTGKQLLNDKQINTLFELSLRTAYKDAEKFIPDLFNQPRNVKLALIDLAFNLGYDRLSKFKNTKAHLIAGDYNKAANELMNSKWAGQVKRRAQNLAKLLVTA